MLISPANDRGIYKYSRLRLDLTMPIRLHVSTLVDITQA